MLPVAVVVSWLILIRGLFVQQELEYVEQIQKLSDNDLYILWQETSISTDLNQKFFIELDGRGYFDEKRFKEEKKAEKLLKEKIQQTLE